MNHYALCHGRIRVSGPFTVYVQVFEGWLESRQQGSALSESSLHPYRAESSSSETRGATYTCAGREYKQAELFNTAGEQQYQGSPFRLTCCSGSCRLTPVPGCSPRVWGFVVATFKRQNFESEAHSGREPRRHLPDTQLRSRRRRLVQKDQGRSWGEVHPAEAKKHL